MITFILLWSGAMDKFSSIFLEPDVKTDNLSRTKTMYSDPEKYLKSKFNSSNK